MHTEFVEYSDGKNSMTGFFARPEDDAPRPVVLVAHAAYGCTEFEQDKAKELVKLGYAAFATDVYARGRQAKDREEGVEWMSALIADRMELRSRIQAGLETAKTLSGVDADKLAAFGFCFGGLTLLELARSGARLNGVVCFHGLLTPADPPPPQQKIDTRLLMLHGDLDPLVPPEQVVAFQQEMREAGVDWEMISYGQAAHSFTMPQAKMPEQGMYYHERTAQRAWQAAVQFLEEVFA